MYILCILFLGEYYANYIKRTVGVTMRKKVITSAVIILILSIILLLINHYKGHNSIAAPEITLVYAENQVEVVLEYK